MEVNLRSGSPKKNFLREKWIDGALFCSAHIHLHIYESCKENLSCTLMKFERENRTFALEWAKVWLEKNVMKRSHLQLLSTDVDLWACVAASVTENISLVEQRMDLIKNQQVFCKKKLKIKRGCFYNSIMKSSIGLKMCKLKLFPWPSLSIDLSIIENLWRTAQEFTELDSFRNKGWKSSRQNLLAGYKRHLQAVTLAKVFWVWTNAEYTGFFLFCYDGIVKLL